MAHRRTYISFQSNDAGPNHVHACNGEGKGKDDAGHMCLDNEFVGCDVSVHFHYQKNLINLMLRNEAHIGSIPDVLCMAL